MQMNFRLGNRLQSTGLKFMAFYVHSGDCPCPPAQTPVTPLALNYPFPPKITQGMTSHSSFSLASEWHIAAYLQLVVQPQNGNFELSTLGNILRFIFSGWWLAIGHLVTALILFLNIIGSPFGLQHLKLAVLVLAQIGKQILATRKMMYRGGTPSAATPTPTRT